MGKLPQSKAWMDLLALECLSWSPAGEMGGAGALKGFQEGKCCFYLLTYVPIPHPPPCEWNIHLVPVLLCTKQCPLPQSPYKVTT